MPNEFLTFPGYEWSAYESEGGHRNVFYASEYGEIFHSRTDFPVPADEDSPYKMAPTVPELYANLKDVKEQKVFVFEHSHSTNPSIHEPSLELAVEVHSGWGTFEWIIQDALRLGYRVGVVANSDGHRGRPGAEYPSSVIDGGAMGGLTAVLAEKLDRDTEFSIRSWRTSLRSRFSSSRSSPLRRTPEASSSNCRRQRPIRLAPTSRLRAASEIL